MIPVSNKDKALEETVRTLMGIELDSQPGETFQYVTINYDILGLIIDSLKENIDKYRPFSKQLADSLHEKSVVEWTYNSNVIEGNTLVMVELQGFY